MLGCDNAGKSTLIAGMVGRPVESTIPTVGFDRATMVFNHESKGGSSSTPMRLFDVGGGSGIRGIWDAYYSDVHGAVFVVDAADASRFEEACELLHAAYTHEALGGKPLLVLANKQDLAGAASAAELASALRLHDLGGGVGNVPYHVAAVSALKGPVGSGQDSRTTLAIAWLRDKVIADYAALEERRVRQVAEQKAREAKAKEERKARLAAKRAAREAAEKEAEEAAKRQEAQVAAPPAPAGGLDTTAPTAAPATDDLPLAAPDNSPDAMLAGGCKPHPPATPSKVQVGLSAPGFGGLGEVAAKPSALPPIGASGPPTPPLAGNRNALPPLAAPAAPA